MNLEARKIDVVQNFLSKEELSQHEKTLEKEKNSPSKRGFEPIAPDELNKRVDQSDSDFRNNRFKSSSELLARYN